MESLIKQFSFVTVQFLSFLESSYEMCWDQILWGFAKRQFIFISKNYVKHGQNSFILVYNLMCISLFIKMLLISS